VAASNSDPTLQYFSYCELVATVSGFLTVGLLTQEIPQLE
jgi:hypothetical protein